ncbi:hypothetical protein [Chromobacterium phragmitis]|uniref:Uncharacterized protein n=1 Tax=Chromobacterium phragmitis TaxID=2202141 RepID=A0ABV0INZ1_9NEIS
MMNGVSGAGHPYLLGLSAARPGAQAAEASAFGDSLRAAGMATISPPQAAPREAGAREELQGGMADLKGGLNAVASMLKLLAADHSLTPGARSEAAALLANMEALEGRLELDRSPLSLSRNLNGAREA